MYSCLLLLWALNLFLQFTELLPMTLSLKQILLLFLCLHSSPKIINVKHLLHSDIYLRQVFIACSFSIVWLFCQKDIFFREKIDSLLEQKIVNEKNKAFWHLKHSVRFFSSACQSVTCMFLSGLSVILSSISRNVRISSLLTREITLFENEWTKSI